MSSYTRHLSVSVRWTLSNFGTLHIEEMLYEYRIHVAVECHHLRGRGYRFPRDCYIGSMEVASDNKQETRRAVMALDWRFVSSS